MDAPAITQFVGEYDFLSNGYNHKITFNGLNFLNAEAAFYAQKVKDDRAKIKFTRLSGNKARAKAAQAQSIPDWEFQKDNIMIAVLRTKFSDPELKQKLLDTYPSKLINTTTFRDTYWGFSDGKGKNKLGELLELVRQELKEKE